MGLDPDDPRHGKYTTYTNHLCRCDLCRKAHAEKHRAYMARNPDQQAKHRQRSRAAWKKSRSGD